MLDFLLVILLGLEIDKQRGGFYVNIYNIVCYALEDKCYASRLIIKIAYHIIMLPKNIYNNDSVENILLCGSIRVT